MRKLIMLLLGVVLISGCATGANIKVVSSLTNKSTEIISDPVGARIEINGEYIGETPVIVEINRYCNDLVGAEYCNVTISAIPRVRGQYTQSKFFNYSVRIPKKIFFDMHLEPTSPKQQYDVNINKDK